MMILRAENLTKTYRTGTHTVTAVNNVCFSVEEGSSCAVVGPSGSGKTTLLGLCAGLDRPSSGRVILNSTDLNDLGEEELAKLRSRYVGFVFQTFQLIPTLNVLENVMVPAELRGEKDINDRAVELLDQVGLSDRVDHYPAQLSGGEQQRVALARAFITRPKILFADELTGNLDSETGHKVTRLLFDLNYQAGTTLVLVTHDIELAHQTERIIRLKGGSIVSDESLTASSEDVAL